MISTRKNKAILVLILALVMSVLAPFVMQVNNYAKAGGEVKTVSEVTFSMDKGASIYNGSGEYASKKGVKFSASMSEQDYIDLTNNVGEDKLYSSLMFGVIIAPSSYETTYGKFNATNLFGIVDGQKSGTAIYDWAEWDGEKWNYSGTKTRVINIERNELSIDTGKAVCKGSITTILDENLLNAFKGVCYIVAEKNDGGYECAFATENDNVRTVVYVAQQRQQAIKDEIAKLDPTENAQAIAELNAESDSLGTTYIKDTVTNQSVNYTVNHYYEKPNGGYFLYEKTTKSANVNSALSAETEKVLNIPGVTFDSDNANNTKQTVALAQDKSVVNVYYDVEYINDGKVDEIFNITTTDSYTLNIEDEIIAAYTSSMNPLELENKTLTKATVDKLSMSEHEYLYILTENGFVEYPLVMATHVISTADEFVNFINSCVGDSKNSTNWYAVITEDIDLATASSSFEAKTDGDWFGGNLNGLGHEVSGFAPVNLYGMFGQVHSTATIKNMALTNIPTTEYWVLGAQMWGKLSNLYIQCSLKLNGTLRGIAKINSYSGDANTAVVENVVTNVSDHKYSAFQHVTGTVTNSYAISNTLKSFICATDWSVKEGYGKLYETTNDFYTAEINLINSSNGWSKYWQNTSLGLYFGNLLIVENTDFEATETKEMKYLNVVEIGHTGAVSGEKIHSVDLKAMLGKTPNLVMIDSEKVTASDTITLSSSDYEYGTTHTIIFGAGDTIIEQPFMFATHVISNEDEFVTFIDSYSGGNFDPTKSNGTQTWYAILTKDMDMTGKAFTKNKSTSDYYSGTFDGLGHYIDNLTFVSDQGLFGYTSKNSVLKNFAIINIKVTDKYVLSGMISGTVENIYMQGVYTVSGKDRGPLKLDENNSKLKNVVLAVLTKSPAILLVNYSTAASRVSNTCYVISERAFAGPFSWSNGSDYKGHCLKSQEYIPEGGKVYSNSTELLNNAIFIADISAGSTNGWSEYWKLTGDATNGYTLKFGNVTVGSTANA